MPTWKYSAVEAALIDVRNIEDDAIKAFQARIRAFRRLGIPDVPRVGKGKQVAYNERSVDELYFALLLMTAGISPEMIRDFLRLGREHIGTNVGQGGSRAAYLVAGDTADQDHVCGSETALTWLEKTCGAARSEETYVLIQPTTLAPHLEGQDEEGHFLAFPKKTIVRWIDEGSGLIDEFVMLINISEALRRLDDAMSRVKAIEA